MGRSTRVALIVAVGATLGSGAFAARAVVNASIPGFSANRGTAGVAAPALAPVAPAGCSEAEWDPEHQRWKCLYEDGEKD